MADHAEPALGPSTAVITVSFGSNAVLASFLESTRTASSSPLRVVVVDNLPSTQSRTRGDIAEVSDIAHVYGADYLPAGSNLGYGGAINLGVRTLPPEVEWVIISNPDVILSPGCIDLLRDRALGNERIGMVGPAIRSSDGSLYPSARSLPSLTTGIGHALLANAWPSNPWTRRYRRDVRSADAVPREAGWLSGACLLIRRSLFDFLGGFDSSFFMYFEDVDLGLRVSKAGYSCVYEPAARVTHSGAHSTNRDPVGMIEAHHSSAKRYLFRRYSGAALSPVRVAIGIGLDLRFAIIRRRLAHGSRPRH